MKCKKHLAGDLTGLDTGVCASCLRERLFVLITTQAQLHSHSYSSDDRDKDDGVAVDPEVRRARRSLPPIPRPHLLPRPVSPGVKRHRKSSSYCELPRRRFLGTPQVGPTFSSNTVRETGDFVPERKKPSTFSLLGVLFGNISRRVRGGAAVPPPNPPNPTSQPSPSSSIFGFWRKNQFRASSSTTASSASTFQRKRETAVSNRGMSPAGESDHEETRDVDGYASEDYPSSWRRSPWSSTAAATARRRRTTNTPRQRNLPGFVLCLSPMVRASPSGNRRKKACMGTAEVGVAMASAKKGWRHSVDAALG